LASGTLKNISQGNIETTDNVESKLVFISCGQFTPEERDLGRLVAERINQEPGLQGYFAQNQSTLDGLTTDILRKLHECSGFIGIMHHRGKVSTKDRELIRASVWIEQEIAIAAYMKQVRRKEIEVRLFLQTGISLEGIREKLGINPHEFQANDEVLAELDRILPTFRDSLKQKEPETLQERLSQCQHNGETVTVRGDLPKNPLVGNKRWPGSSQSNIHEVTEGHVTFFKLESGSYHPVSLKHITSSFDFETGQQLFLIED
jgi:hypothetical protein